MIPFTLKNDGLTFAVRVQPSAPRTRIIGEHDGALKIALAAPPVDGKANAECIRFLAQFLDVSRRDIEIISGETARTKVIFLHRISAKQFEEKLSHV